MRIGDVYRELPFGLSIEIFPPKTTAGDEALFATLERASHWNPAFISCTYGAGGSTRHRTIDLCAKIQNDYDVSATAHFTCVGSTRDELRDWLETAHSHGISNIMALRGDPPVGQEQFVQVEGGLQYANELVTLIRDEFPDFGIGVAGYPEKHPEARNLETDLQNLCRKVNAGADAIFTQLFYDNDSFLRFREDCEESGIELPIVPGIMPITEFARIKRITSMCGADIPSSLFSKLEAAQDDDKAQFEIGVEFAIQQCQALIYEGVPGIHFYVLNRMDACDRILEALDLPSDS
ncbi:MAG: methylenetetrahydrofolate reductase [NAD(P)H] [Planctomycetota bacterium]|nr:methylenetetrahydrofolate reductase [NAD(P)H] [Planctomycetota bacterium]